MEASDGTRAHLRTGDMSFIEDVAGKGHRTFETGSQSVFLQVPEGFDIEESGQRASNRRAVGNARGHYSFLPGDEQSPRWRDQISGVS